MRIPGRAAAVTAALLVLATGCSSSSSSSSPGTTPSGSSTTSCPASVPVSFGSSPITTSIAAPNRNPVTTARDRNWAIHPIFATARTRKKIPESRVTPATNAATSASSVSPAAKTALAATAGGRFVAALVPAAGAEGEPSVRVVVYELTP